jgi:hypothetical protein
MFDLRYHVASLAAVFLALIIGILVGVGISDRGLVDTAKRSLLERRVASLQRELDRTRTESADRARERQAARTYVNETYPALMQNRLKNKQIAVVVIGSVSGGDRILPAVRRTLDDSGGQQLRLRALKVPLDVQQVESALKGLPEAKGLRGRQNLENLGRAVGDELASGGETPLLDALTPALVEERTGATKAPADGIVVLRTASPQKGATTRFLIGLYSGLAGTAAPAVGVEPTDAAYTAVPAFRQSGLSTVDDIDQPMGRLSLALLLQGAPAGQYGLKASAGNGALPPLPTASASGG